MLDVLLLRLEAPLLSFGAAAVDKRGVIQGFPPLSLLTGLMGNALGYSRREGARLNALSTRVRYAARCDKRGTRLTDFQTVDLGQDFLLAKKVAWTSRGVVQRREGSVADGTHIRERDYWADSIHSVALTLLPGEGPTVDALAQALTTPERPLFIGRKGCIPSAPLLLGRLQASSLREALEKLPRAARGDAAPRGLEAVWPAEEGGDDASSEVLAVTDERDFTNQIHVGRRLVRRGLLTPAEASA